MALAAVGCCLAAAAYAATAPSGEKEARGASRPLRPRLIEMPPRTSAERSAEFSFAQPQRPPARARPGRPLQYECRLDQGAWEGCRSPHLLRGLGLGRHKFEVRATNRAGHSGPAAGREWRVVKRARAEEAAPAPVAPSTPVVVPVAPEEPTPPSAIDLTIEADTSALQPLLPGKPAQPLPVTIANPNSSPVFVTSLRVSAGSGRPECPAATNFDLTPAGVSDVQPLEVPANGSATLSAAAGIAPPRIAMRELPVNQDPCRGATLELVFEADAHG